MKLTFFRKGEQEDIKHVSERYIAKSDPYIVMVSTPNAPDGLFEHIEKEDEETCLYKRLLLDYTLSQRNFCKTGHLFYRVLFHGNNL
jgi:hypothetical protein